MNEILRSWKLFAHRRSMSLPRLSVTPRAALHSSRSHAGMQGRRAWLRDTTVWLALGLSIATTMVVLARTTSDTPTTSADLTVTHTGRATSPESKSRTTPSTLGKSGSGAPSPKRPSTLATRSTATTTTLVERAAQTTTTTLLIQGHVTGATIPSPISPAVAVVTEQWAGVLTYPNVVATSYSFTTTGGVVVVRTSLGRGAAELSSSLQCTDSSVVTTSDPDETTMTAPPGSCTYNLQFVDAAFESGARAAYRITAQYPAVVPAS
jgi:hypothetical protein